MAKRLPFNVRSYSAPQATPSIMSSAPRIAIAHRIDGVTLGLLVGIAAALGFCLVTLLT